MGIFSTKSPKTVTENKFTWKTNVIEITEDGYLQTRGLIDVVRIPLRHIDTITYTMKTLKPTITPELKIIGQGVELGTITVGMDLVNEIQDWLLEKIEK